MTGGSHRAAFPKVEYSLAIISFDSEFFMGPVGAMRQGVHVVFELGEVFPWQPFLVLIEYVVSKVAIR
jgi:hypothetical protein